MKTTTGRIFSIGSTSVIVFVLPLWMFASNISNEDGWYVATSIAVAMAMVGIILFVLLKNETLQRSFQVVYGFYFLHFFSDPSSWEQ